jgi:hypothetical protein
MHADRNATPVKSDAHTSSKPRTFDEVSLALQALPFRATARRWAKEMDGHVLAVNQSGAVSFHQCRSEADRPADALLSMPLSEHSTESDCAFIAALIGRPVLQLEDAALGSEVIVIACDCRDPNARKPHGRHVGVRGRTTVTLGIRHVEFTCTAMHCQDSSASSHEHPCRTTHVLAFDKEAPA